MSKRSDDSIEQFFKKAVAQQDTSHLDSDWQKMEKMLDERAISASAPKVRAQKIVAYTIIGALFLSGLYLAVFRPWQAVSTDQHISQPIQNAKPSQAAAGVLGPLSGTKENPSADLLFSPSKTEAPALDIATVNEQVKAVHERQTGNVNKTPRSSVPIPLAKEMQAESIDGKNDLASGVELPSPTIALTPLSDILNTEGIISQSAASPIIDTEIADDPLTDKISPKEEIAEKNLADKGEEKKQPFTNSPSPWSLALSVAPDFSSTNVGRYSAPGTAYGLFVSYRPLPRWQLSTGLIKIAKQYEGYGEEYQPPSGYWENRTNGIIPDEVEGSCGIIEWPLILRFDFVAKGNSRFYVASGVSSYIMRTESYKYKFAQENPGAASGWNSAGPTSYTFSIGHLSAGYERSFSNRIAVAIEPYFKVPFKAIGWSNISLHSTGAYLTVRYTFQNQSIVTTQK